MAKEIERKFLVKGESWKSFGSLEIRQGYLSTDKARTVRVRTKGGKAFLTVKGLTEGASRDEFEYEIPFEDGSYMLDKICEHPIVEKRRYLIEFAGKTWELDEFFGDNLGLVVAEIELGSEDEEFSKPDWVTDEVTSDSRYFNSSLIHNPYSKW